MSTSSSQSARDESAVPRMIQTIESMSTLVGADLDRKTIGVILNLIDAGVSAESISDVILELRSERLAEQSGKRT